MKAVTCRGVGGVEVLAITDLPEPVPRADALIVRNFATALNRADLLQRRGLYPPPAGESEVLGLEFFLATQGVVLLLGDRAVVEEDLEEFGVFGGREAGAAWMWDAWGGVAEEAAPLPAAEEGELISLDDYISRMVPKQEDKTYWIL